MTMTSRQEMTRAAFTAELIDGARASNQTVFENSDRLADDDGVVFVTAVPDAPLQVLGRLGRDGRWYIGTLIVAPLDHPSAPEDLPCSLVLRSEPVAEAMIRDGRMPSPEQASKHREERLQHDRERRARQPSEIRRRQKREEEERRFHVLVEAESDDQEEPPLWEVVADALDFADPELWKSNSFARLRGRLIVSLKAAIADHEYRLARWGRHLGEDDEQQLARAREILALLTGGPAAAAADAEAAP